LGCLGAFFLVYLISLPLIIFLADTSVRDSLQSTPTTPDSTPSPDAVEFGTGGTGCTPATTATTFSTRDRIRLVAANVPGGGDVTIRLVQYGKALAGYPVIRPTDPTSGCVDDVLPPLPVGHYEV
jgi:hypothetical protein